MTTRPDSANTARRRAGADKAEAVVAGAFIAGISSGKGFSIRTIARGGPLKPCGVPRCESGTLQDLLAPAGAGIERPAGGIASDAQQGLVGADANVGLRGIDATVVETELLEESILIDRHWPRQWKGRGIGRTVLCAGRKNSE